MAWGKNGTPKILTVSGDTITISDLTSKVFNHLSSYLIQKTGNIRAAFRIGNGSIDSGTNYSNTDGENGAAHTGSTSQTYHKTSGSNGYNGFVISHSVNPSSKEKLFISFYAGANAVGAGNPPTRMESSGKSTLSSQYDQIQKYNDQAGDYDVDSWLFGISTD